MVERHRLAEIVALPSSCFRSAIDDYTAPSAWLTNMSRKGLYRHGRTHNVVYGPDTDTTVTYWTLGTVVGTATSNPANSEEEQKSYKFNTVNWYQTQTHEPVRQDPIVKASMTPWRQTVATKKSDQSDALTASDIRGAVGGEAIPGIASDTYSGEKPKDDAMDVDQNGKVKNEPDIVTERLTSSTSQVNSPASNGGTSEQADTDAKMSDS